MSKRVALYLRVSTTDKGQTNETQAHVLREYCDRRGWSIVATYEDQGSGGNTNRKQFQQLKKDAFTRAFDVVLVFRFDRFARSLLELLSSLEEFQSLGVEFVSYSEQMDTTTPGGKALFAIAGVFAEFERGIASERIKAGMQRARSQGKKIGRPKVRKMKLEDEIVAMIQDGHSTEKTRKALGVAKSHVEKVRKKRKSDLQQTNLISP